MMQITDQIHKAFLDVLRCGAVPVDHDLPERIRDLSVAPEERDRLWTELLEEYRTGPRSPWAAVVLEAMGKDIAVIVASIPTLPTAISRMEVAQQVVTEILEAALDGPTVPARWSPNRLLTLATRGTHRWLAREARSLGETSRLEDEPEDNQARELVSMIAERARRERRTFGFDVLYRQEVLGESVARIAAEMGVSENTLRLRRRRAIQKLRRELAA